MTDLTLEELAEGDTLLDGAEAFPESEEVEAYAGEWLWKHRAALLAMARELVRLKSALDFFDGQERFIDPTSFVDDAIASGWEDPLPPSERKGEG
jgi:hypothetical protein